MVYHILHECFVLNVRIMLGCYYHPFYPFGDITVVFNGHQRFAVRPQIPQRSVFTDICKPFDKLVGNYYRHWHELRSLARGKTIHKALVTRAQPTESRVIDLAGSLKLPCLKGLVDTLSNIA